MTAGLDDKWQKLEEATGSGERLLRALPDKDLPVYVTYDPDSRRRGVRVILPANSVLRALPRWREVDISQEADADGWATHLRLGNERFEIIFSALAGDIVESLRGQDRRRWVTILRDRIQFWRQFFRERGFEGLSVEKQRGLYAELVTLQSKLLPILDAGEAVTRWSGPNARPHDFELAAGDVEVKAATREKPNEVRINGLAQLDDGGKILLLHVVTLEPGPDHGETLPALVASIRTALASDASTAVRFERRLQEAGYLDVHEDEYGTLLQVSGEATYVVDGDFPRITEVPEAVTRVKYDLDLSTATSFRTDTLRAFRDACGGGA